MITPERAPRQGKRSRAQQPASPAQPEPPSAVEDNDWRKAVEEALNAARQQP